jgi:tRNA A37 threonylcarbamoyltransferase TsaD
LRLLRASFMCFFQLFLLFMQGIEFLERLDIAVGNCFDCFARDIQLSNDPSPGCNILFFHLRGKVYHPLPYAVKGLRLCFNVYV